jgi:hypothetical protein
VRRLSIDVFQATAEGGKERRREEVAVDIIQGHLGESTAQMQECKNAGMQECRNAGMQECKEEGLLSFPFCNPAILPSCNGSISH